MLAGSEVGIDVSVDANAPADENAWTWSPPVYDVFGTPTLQHTAHPFARSDALPDCDARLDFVRAARWCPDGSAALAQCESGAFVFLDIPPTLLTSSYSPAPPPAPTRHPFAQPAPILDFAWYPSASAHAPPAFCFAASVRGCPVRLLDGADGRVRASYRIVDHRERQVAPHSLAFSPAGERLYCGFEDAIEVFDVARPGEGTRLATTPSRKTREGLKGIISALAFSPPTADNAGLFAAGSLTPSAPFSRAYASNLALFTESTGGRPVMFLGAGEGPREGITQVHFNPARPYVVYAARRRTPGIWAWDVRGAADAPVCVFRPRPVVRPVRPGAGTGMGREEEKRTNQKLRFDVESSGRWGAVGEPDGSIAVFDLTERAAPDLGDGAGADANEPGVVDDDAIPIIDPVLTFKAHGDAVGSVSFHPLRAALLSVCGARHFGRASSYSASSSSSSSSSSTSSSDEENESPSASSSEDAEDATMAAGAESRTRKQKRQVRIRMGRRAGPAARDTSVKLWDFAGGGGDVLQS